MEKNEKQGLLEKLDVINDELVGLMDIFWDDERMWNEVAEIRTHVLIARTKVSTLP